LATFVMHVFPETPLARSLHRWLVEVPLTVTARLKRRHILMIVILLCCGQTLAMIGSADLALAYAIDLSIYADAAIALSLAALVGRVRSAGWAARQQAGRAVARLRRSSRLVLTARSPPPLSRQSPDPSR
jgi:hypothetical protein